MLQSHDESVVLVSDEDFLILNQDLLESVHVSRLYAVDDLEVWRKWFLEERLGEDLSVWNFTHKELNNNLEFLNLNSKGFGPDLWSFSQCLNESGLRFRVLELDGLDSTQVVQISRILVIRDILREGGLDRELTSWLVEVLRKVGSQNDVGDGSLADEILSKTCCLV